MTDKKSDHEEPQERKKIPIYVHQENFAKSYNGPNGVQFHLGGSINVAVSGPDLSTIKRMKTGEDQPEESREWVGSISLNDETIEIDKQDRASQGTDVDMSKQGFIISKSLDKSSDGKSKSTKVPLLSPTLNGSQNPVKVCEDASATTETFTTPSSTRLMMNENLPRPSLGWGARVSVNTPARRTSEHEVTWIEPENSEESELSSESELYEYDIRPSIVVNMDGARGTRISFTFDKLEQDVKDYLTQVWEEETESLTQASPKTNESPEMGKM